MAKLFAYDAGGGLPVSSRSKFEEKLGEKEGLGMCPVFYTPESASAA